MHCPQCGRANRSDAAFCDACGIHLLRSEETHHAAVMPAVATQDQAVVGSPQQQSMTSVKVAEDVFVGRQAELGLLQAALEDTLAGRGRLVMLAGEPGIGKTRTAQEFAAYAQKRGALVLWGRCHEIIDGIQDIKHLNGKI